MKKYIVIKAFQDVTGFKQVGESIDLDDDRAAKLRRHGLIGINKEESAQEHKEEEIKEVKEPEKKTSKKVSK